MQASLDFTEKGQPQRRQPLGLEQPAPNSTKKRSKSARSEYAYSIKTSRVKERDFPYDGRQLSCTMDLVNFARSLGHSDIEKMLTIYLDAQNHVLCIQVNSGTVNQAVVYPREIIRHALLSASSSMIMVHNHPSGYPRPSDADIHLTKKVREAARMLDILVHDHIILGAEDHFFSFREEGLM